MFTKNTNETEAKRSIVGVYVQKSRILSFIEALRYKYKVKYKNIHIYELERNNKEYLVSIKTYDKDRIVAELRGSVFHIKHGCLFSINGLNKLVEKVCNGKKDLDYHINWEDYTDKLIVTQADELSISTIKKIENWSTFFEK